MSKWLTASLTLICVAALVYSRYFYQPHADTVIQLPQIESCVVNQTACIVTIADKFPIEFAITPPNAKPMTPLTLTLKGEHITAASVTIDGVNMDMPGFPIKLKPSNDQTTLNTMSGETSLAICSFSMMEWRANLIVTIENNQYLIPFFFTTQN